MPHPSPFASPRDGKRLSPSGLAWPSTWTLPKAGGRLRNGVAIGIGALTGVIAIAILADPNEDPYLGWALLLVTATCALAPAVMRVGRRRDALILGPIRDGSKHRGVTFPDRRASAFAASGCLLTMGAAGILLWKSTDPGASGDPALLACGFIFLVASALVLLRPWRDKGFVLTEQAIIYTQRGKTRVVPWEAILAVTPLEYGTGRHVIKLLLQDDSERGARAPSLSRTGATLWVNQQVNDPALSLHAILHYLTTPENRHELATTAALERLANGDLPSDEEDGIAIA